MFKRLYLYLFNRITDALEALAAGDAERARALLMEAQQHCEEEYLDGEED